MFDTASISTVVPIQGTFDIAQARSTLRIRIAQQRWPTAFSAHAATALTALGEFILALSKPQPTLVRITVIKQPGKCGIELKARFCITDSDLSQWQKRKYNLERAAPDTRFIETRDDVEITSCIWVK